MAHAFSVEIHNFISHRIALCEEKKRAAEEQADLESMSFYQGQLKELFALREYLTEKIDLKTQKYY